MVQYPHAESTATPACLDTVIYHSPLDKALACMLVGGVYCPETVPASSSMQTSAKSIDRSRLSHQLTQCEEGIVTGCSGEACCMLTK